MRRSYCGYVRAALLLMIGTDSALSDCSMKELERPHG
jgi:hypothetical protein